MANSALPPVVEPTFRERLPDRLTVFLVGLALAVVVGSAVGLLLDVALAKAVGYAMILLGVAAALGGGLTGGRYEVYGIGYGLGRNHTMRGDGSRVTMDSLRGGYDRPQADPVAFWKVIGGLLYLAMGLALLVFAS